MPGRAPDRNFISVRRKLAGEYHGNDGSGPDIHGVVIVFCRFDDECHVPKLLFERLSLNRKPISPLNLNLDRFGGLRCAPNCACNSIMYWRKQYRSQAAIDAVGVSPYPYWVGPDDASQPRPANNRCRA